MLNKTISMTIAEIEKSSNEFKNTHKINVSGSYDDEQVPRWFKTYKEEIDKKFEDLDTKMPTWFKIWFKSYDQKMENRFQSLDNRIDNLVKKNNLKE